MVKPVKPPLYDKGPILGCGKPIRWRKDDTLSELAYQEHNKRWSAVLHAGTCGLNECCGYIYCERCAKRAGVLW